MKSETKRITFNVALEFAQRIDNEAQKRNMKRSEFIIMVLSNFLNENREKNDTHIIKLENIPQIDGQMEDTKNLEIIDLDSFKLKKVADEFNNSLNTVAKEDVESEYRKLLREKKRKENNYNGSS
ncbi:MAG: hypothetical protein NC489_23330 [Ruminococcus flavefaciens]|nr:hypothetical protein [Ruminococcus flavefaciens]